MQVRTHRGHAMVTAAARQQGDRGDRVWRGLDATQADGLACVVCQASYLTVHTRTAR